MKKFQSRYKIERSIKYRKEDIEGLSKPGSLVVYHFLWRGLSTSCFSDQPLLSRPHVFSLTSSLFFLLSYPLRYCLTLIHSRLFD